MGERVSVIILAAGLGTRMRSKKAKVLHRVGGMCLLEHVVRAAKTVAAAGDIIAVVGHQAEQVKAEVAGHGIRFALQAEQKGTGHAVLQGAGMDGVGKGRVLVLNGDGPLLSGETLQRLLGTHAAMGGAATVVTTHVENPTGYGRVVVNAGGFLEAIVEEKAATPEQRRINEINSGFYCFEAEELWRRLAALPPNPASGEIYLTDMVDALRRDGLKTARCLVEDARELLGINNREELAEADRVMRERKVRELMRSGVTIEKPETVTVDVGVRVGADTVIEAHAQLLGETVIGEDCRVGACAVVKNTAMGDGSAVLQFTLVEDCELGASVSVGPFARMRNHAVLEDGARVGNFVELKNARMKKGAKANHLAYLGDAEIGAKANIGAGTITCNYDGKNKHRTVIGEGAFIGSNATLVAPVTVGDGAYVAAGSTITKPVPGDALGVGRSRQENKEGWAKAKREKLARGG